MYYLGMDGGGTKTEAVLCDETGRILRYARAGATAPASVPPGQIRETLSRLYASLRLRDAGPVRGFAGVSGCDEPWCRQILEDAAAQAAPEGLSLTVRSDTVCALSAGVGPGRDGLLLIAGTGSVAVLRRGGRLFRAGGYGHLVGDEGSGFDMGRRAIVSALKAQDGRGRPTLLLRLIEEKTGAPIPDITQTVYAEGGREAVASFAGVLLSAAEAGDAAALEQLTECVSELALSVQAVRRQAGAGEADPIPVVAAGGVLTHSPYLQALLQNRLGAGDFRVLTVPPVYGAVLEAAEDPDGSFSAQFLKDWEQLERN